MARMQPACTAKTPERGPDRLPRSVRAYLAHTAGSVSLRALARARGVHPSTILRQVRHVEALRDDPLADAALTRLETQWKQLHPENRPFAPESEDNSPMQTRTKDTMLPAPDVTRALTAMMEPRTILVVADGVEDAVVVTDAGGDRPVRRAVVGRDAVEELALREFVAGEQTGRLMRYRITAAGRAEAGRLIAARESRRAALDPAAENSNVALFSGPGPRPEGAPHSAGAEAPLEVLARRKRADGEVWLPRALTDAAQRFRESWEIARIGGGLTEDWEELVSGAVSGAGGARGAGRHDAAAGLAEAIRALGPDLAETVLRCVCQGEGMEEIEKRLDFPARSGKIVLRIALRTLARHYETVGSEGYDLIS